MTPPGHFAIVKIYNAEEVSRSVLQSSNMRYPVDIIYTVGQIGNYHAYFYILIVKYSYIWHKICSEDHSRLSRDGDRAPKVLIF